MTDVLSAKLDERLELIELLNKGVPALGLHEDNSTELFDIEAANDVMADAARALASQPLTAETGEVVGTLECEAMESALRAIDSIIAKNIRDNGTDINRMKVGDEWYTGPAVDASFRILRGLQQIAANALTGKE